MTPENITPATPELERLQPFVGHWSLEGRIVEGPFGPATPISATDIYEWMPGGHFLLHHIEAQMGDQVVKGLEVIGYDLATRRYCLRSFDHAGGFSVMHMTEADGLWTALGHTERSQVRFSADGKVMSGGWERLADDGAWRPWMEITLTKNKAAEANGGEAQTASTAQRYEIETLLEVAFDELIREIGQFTPETFNAKPADGGWTAGQVAEHLRQSYGVLKVLHMEPRPTFRPIDANLPALKTIFLDFGAKYQTPDFIDPPEGRYDPAAMAADISRAKDAFLEAARTQDLSLTCEDDIFPDHTRLEWLHFVVMHTLRHTRQMRRLRISE